MIETFFSILIFLMLSIGTSHAWSHAEVFLPVRNVIAKIFIIRKMLLCPECASFWVGLSISFLFNPLITIFTLPSFYLLVIPNVFCGIITYLFASYLYKKGILE